MSNRAKIKIDSVHYPATKFEAFNDVDKLLLDEFAQRSSDSYNAMLVDLVAIFNQFNLTAVHDHKITNKEYSKVKIGFELDDDSELDDDNKADITAKIRKAIGKCGGSNGGHSKRARRSLCVQTILEYKNKYQLDITPTLATQIIHAVAGVKPNNATMIAAFAIKGRDASNKTRALKDELSLEYIQQCSSELKERLALLDSQLGLIRAHNVSVWKNIWSNFIR